jgi:hypothetical protein
MVSFTLSRLSSQPTRSKWPAFRLKIRTDALEAASVTDSNVYVEKAKLAREMAKILRENVVQGEKVEGDATWSRLIIAVFLLFQH